MTFRLVLGTVALWTALLWVGCGGKAVVDASRGDGGASATSTTTSSTQPTTTTSGCQCSDSLECPSAPSPACGEAFCDGCSCQVEPYAVGTECFDGPNWLCDGAGRCVECVVEEDCASGQCVDNRCELVLPTVCQNTCDALDGCGQSQGPDCAVGCVMALGGCTQEELNTLTECNQFLTNGCNYNAWESCAISITCLGG